MPKLHLSYTNDEVSGMEPIPAGLYEAKIDTSESEVGETDNGNMYVTIAFVIENHPEYAGRKINQRYFLGEKSRWKLNTMLNNLGLLPEKEGAYQLDTDTLHGIQCKIKVKQRTYEGNTYNDVAYVVQRDSAAADARKTINF